MILGNTGFQGYITEHRLLIIIYTAHLPNLSLESYSTPKGYTENPLYSAKNNEFFNSLLEYRLANAIQIRLVVDAQNTEVHAGKHFNGYVETRAFQANETLRKLKIQHLESHKVAGLRAVDYCSWAVFRKYEFGDNRFHDLLKDQLNPANCQVWFY